jgi:hypothetical protein
MLGAQKKDWLSQSCLDKPCVWLLTWAATLVELMTPLPVIN